MPPTPIERFLLDIDAKWPSGGPKIALRVLGSTALMLQTYLDVVCPGLPFLPHPVKWNPTEFLNANLRCFEVLALDTTDVVVSKLKRFHDNDKADIKAMVELGVVGHVQLVDRFLSAADRFSMDARASELSRYAQNLNWVEREYLGVEETQYELPPWADA